MAQTTHTLRWSVATLLFLSTGLNYLDRQTLSILATTIQADLKIDDMGYAQITSYFLVSYTIMYAVSGRLVDFLGTRRSLALAVSGWSLAGMLHGVANSAGQLAACRLLLGTFESANNPLPNPISLKIQFPIGGWLPFSCPFGFCSFLCRDAFQR